MSGSLAFAPQLGAPGAHDHFDLLTTRGSLRLTDPRRFGAVVWSADLASGAAARLLGGLGVEPFDPVFTGSYLHAALQRRRVAVKQALLAGDIVVGAGNIYACEALHSAGIDPRLRSDRLSRPRCERLAQAVRDTLARAPRTRWLDPARLPRCARHGRPVPAAGRRLRTRGRGLPALRRRHPAHRPRTALDLLLPRMPAPLKGAPPVAQPGPLPERFAAQVVAWQRSAGRHALPWQNTRDPYRVWLSEIMLQQTQVSTVLGYYARFLDRFPDVARLAAASLDDVLAQWSGLGYYSRARNLHRCARVVVEQHGGAFPRRAEQLAELPGIGRSTAAAIAAFCFDERVAILDGNVKRVLSRVLGFDGDLARAAAQRALWDHATQLLPAVEAGEGAGASSIASYTQGLMDLGAGICSVRAPACLICPVQPLCRAALAGEPERFPVKTRTLRRGARASHWLAPLWRDRLWLVQRPPTGIWAGLWSLCEYDSAAALQAATAGWPGAQRELAPFTHVLTHLDWTLSPRLHRLPDGLDEAALAGLTARLPQAASGRWFTRAEMGSLGLPAAVTRVLPQLR